MFRFANEAVPDRLTVNMITTVYLSRRLATSLRQRKEHNSFVIRAGARNGGHLIWINARTEIRGFLENCQLTEEVAAPNGRCRVQACQRVQFDAQQGC